MDSGDDRSSVTFHFVVKDFINSVTVTNNLFSLPCMIRNIPWKIAVKKTDNLQGKNVVYMGNDNSQGKYLGIYFHCFANNQTESDCVCHQNWNCLAKAKLSVLNLNNRNENVVLELDHVFYSGSAGWGWNSFIEWNKVTDPKNGFIVDNTVIIRAEVVVGTPMGITLKTKDNDNASKLLESEKKIQSLESQLQLLKSDLASQKADMLSKMKTWETIITNVVLQISEMKKVKGSVAQNGSNNLSTDDMRSELRDALLSLLGVVKSE